MAKNDMTTCQSCGAEISAKGKVVCPSCGRLHKKPIYKRTWFIVLAVIFVLGIIGNLGSDDDDTKSPSQSDRSVNTTENEKIIEVAVEEVKIPIVITVDDLIEALDKNALKASNTYKNQYVELTGKLVNIDSAGNYFSIGILKDKFSLHRVLCKIDEKHLDAVMNFEDGQDVTVIGTITIVGEVLGYTLEVESIK